MITIQQKLRLFEPMSFEEILRRDKKPGLTVELSKRLRSRWYVKELRQTGHRKLYLPAVFSDAPEEIKKGLIEWALLPIRKSGKTETVRRRKQLEKVAFDFLRDKGMEPQRRRYDPDQFEQNTVGTRYDLREVFDSVNDRFFDGALQSALRWGKRATTTSYQTSKMDLEGNTFNLITIAGVYDHPDVPRFAIESIMFHEMLHIAEPPQRKKERNSIHTPAFKKRERAFPFYDQWIEWEKQEVRKLLRSLRRKRKTLR